MKYVKILTNFRKVAWGMEGFFFVLIMQIFCTALSREALGGPTQPPVPADSELLNPGLQEISPKVIEIITRKEGPFIEVYMKAFGALKCYDMREYEVSRTNEKTIIIPRLKRSKPASPCDSEPIEFEDKVADLDPSLDSAYSLEVLGHLGWHKKELLKP